MRCERWTLKAGVGPNMKVKQEKKNLKLVSEGLDLILELVIWHKHFLGEKLFEL